MRGRTSRIRERKRERVPAWNDSKESFCCTTRRTVSNNSSNSTQRERYKANHDRSLSDPVPVSSRTRLCVYVLSLLHVLCFSLYVIFWHLSSYALHLVLLRDYPSCVVPSLSLPPLASEHALFPHLVKAAKAHIARQSQTFITKLGRMQAAEQEWKANAKNITSEYHHVQAQLAAFAQPTASTQPRIPGQQQPEAESDRLLFSAPAHAEVSATSVCVAESARVGSRESPRTKVLAERFEHWRRSEWWHGAAGLLPLTGTLQHRANRVSRIAA